MVTIEIKQGAICYDVCPKKCTQIMRLFIFVSWSDVFSHLVHGKTVVTKTSADRVIVAFGANGHFRFNRAKYL